MSKRKIDLRASLNDVADRYVEDNPSDLAALRAGVARRRNRLMAVRVAGLATAAALGIVAFYAIDMGRPVDRSLPPVAPADDAIEVSVPLSGNLYQIAGAGDIAVVTRNRGELARVDAGSDRPIWSTDLGGFPADVVIVADGLWVSDRSNGRIVHLDIATGRVLPDSIELEPGEVPTRMNVGAGAIRVVLRDHSVVRFDRDTGERRVLFEEPVVDTAMGNEAFWVLTSDGRIIAIDPNTGELRAHVTPVTGLDEGEITFARGAVWYGDVGSRELIRVDESDGSVIRSELPGDYEDLDGGSSGLWVLVDTGGDKGQIIEIDPDDGAFIGTRFELEDDPGDLSTGDAGIWVVLRATGRAVYLVP